MKSLFGTRGRTTATAAQAKEIEPGAVIEVVDIDVYGIIDALQEPDRDSLVLRQPFLLEAAP